MHKDRTNTGIDKAGKAMPESDGKFPKKILEETMFICQVAGPFDPCFYFWCRLQRRTILQVLTHIKQSVEMNNVSTASDNAQAIASRTGAGSNSFVYRVLFLALLSPFAVKAQNQ